MSSFQLEPNDCTGQIRHGFKVARELLKAGCNASEVFKPSEEILYQVTKLVEVGIELWIWLFAIGFSRNDRIHTGRPCTLSNAFGVIIALVRDKMVSRAYFCDELVRNFGVVDFTPSDFKIDRISMRIGGNMQLSGCSPA